MAKPKKNKLPVQTASVLPTTSAKAPGSQDEMKWKAEEALRTISRAEEHKEDKELMKHVKILAGDKMRAMEKICK